MPLGQWIDVAAHARTPEPRWPWDEVAERIDDQERRDLAAKLAARSAMRTKGDAGA